MYSRIKCLLSVFLFAATPTVAGAQFNLSADYSTSLNPNGVWSFGTRSSGNLAGTGLAIFTENGNEFGWANYWGTGLPNILRNMTGSTQAVPSLVLAGGEIAMHPGANNDYSIVRFTAPTTGLFAVTSHFYGASDLNTTTDAYVLNDGMQLFSGAVNGFGAFQDYVAVLSLSAGSVVDFAVGYGSNNNYLNDSTGLDVEIGEISTAPEPASVVLVMTGLAGVGLVRRRRLSA